MTERGIEAAIELRHKSRWSESRLDASILPSDDQYNGSWTREDFFKNGATKTFDPANRWMLGVNHDGRLGRLRTHVDYAAVSDLDYYSDLGTE
ncbi:MAG: hypothetical protein CM1200mP9_08730 [Gammaproteobacteria bacterium]|nr:MAG: hypothetical protein CM1200mP9_08730 [Gammaproteobacteria bacterium]